ncbi:MAG: hypothetical protein WCO42_08495 [bacterium]
MKFNPVLFLLAMAAALISGACAVTAAPLSRSQIPADSKWVMHLDMNQFASSQTCRLLSSGQGDAKRFQNMLNHYRNLLGVDPLKDIASLTLFGNEVSGNRGVALISGSLNSKQITSQFSTYSQYTTKKNGRLTLQTWVDKGSGKPLWASFYSSRQLILASDEFSLVNAAWVLDGDRPNLAASKNATLPFPATQPGSFFTAVTKGYSGSNPTQAMILRSTESANLQLAENSGIVDGAILLNADSPETAVQIQQILNGLMVSASFTDAGSPLAKLAELSTLSRNGNTMSLKIHCPAGEAASLVGSLLTQ